MSEMSGGDALVVGPAGARAVRNRHHWLFSGAVEAVPDAENGSLVPVRDSDGDLLGHAYFNRRCSLLARMVSFGTEDPLDAIRRRLKEALAVRTSLLAGRTDAFRVVGAEADGIPGLVVDRYADVAVMQLGTLGLELLRGVLAEMIRAEVGPAALYERSEAPSRREEGLRPQVGWVFGDPVSHVDVREDDRVFRVQLEGSQKTGFYLDQRENRQMIRSLALGRRVLDCFSYTGGFAVAALQGGAADAVLVDASGAALENARVNLSLNGFEGRVEKANCFEYLREANTDRDLVILDPPSFARRRQEVKAACRGYKDINRLALSRVAPGGLVLTCSCSYHVDATLFQQVVFQAAAEAGRTVRILQRHRHALDHSINIYHPETDYLKSLLLHVA